MKYKTLTLISLLSMIVSGLYAQNILPDEKDTVKKTSAALNPVQISVNAEIRVMDSMLTSWYVQQTLHKQNTVLSRLKDDTTAYDNNDSLFAARLRQIVTAVPLAYNERVKRFIELYAVQRQRSSSVILGLAQYYYPWMREIFDKYDVPEELVYITIIESALNPTAVSPAGATGIWQFMYGTGKLYGLEVNTYVDDRRDPYKATDAAARHFRDLYNIFKDWGLAISAYNCGAGNVRKAIQRSGGKTDFWGVCPYLPKETQNYFPAYIGALYMMNYHNLHDIQPVSISIPLDVDTVMVDKELHLEQIANVLDIPLSEITALNPQYKRQIIPAFNVSYPLRLRSADIVRFVDMQDSIERYHYDEYFHPTQTITNEVVQTTPNKYHTVRKGETISKIASKYGLSVSRLKSMNHLKSNTLRVGQKLLVRKGTTIVKPVTPVVADSTTTVVSTDSTLTAPDSVMVQKDSVSTTPNQPVEPEYVVYVVKKGDTLNSIAKRYGKGLSELAKYNRITNMDAIQVGQKIKIPR